jgi:hypothetical protein
MLNHALSRIRVRVVVFNPSFNYILAISWWSVLIVCFIHANEVISSIKRRLYLELLIDV